MTYSRNFLFTCARHAITVLLLLCHCVLRGLYFAYRPCLQNRIEPSTIRSFITMHLPIFHSYGCLQNSYAGSHTTPCTIGLSLSALFLWKSMTRVWIVVVSIRCFVVLSNRRIVQFLQSLIYFRTRHAPSCPQGWRIPDGTSGSASWSWNKSGRGPLNIERLMFRQSCIDTTMSRFNEKCWSPRD